MEDVVNDDKSAPTVKHEIFENYSKHSLNHDLINTTTNFDEQIITERKREKVRSS